MLATNADEGIASLHSCLTTTPMFASICFDFHSDHRFSDTESRPDRTIFRDIALQLLDHIVVVHGSVCHELLHGLHIFPAT